MKYVFVLFIFSFFATIASAQKTEFVIEGHTFYKKGIVRLLVYTSPNQYYSFDSAAIVEGTFFLKDTLDEPKLFSLQIEDENRQLFLGNEHVIVNQNDSTTKEITVTGSSLTNDYDSYTTRWITPLVIKLKPGNQSVINTAPVNQKTIDSLHTISSSWLVAAADSTANFIRQKPNSFVSLYLLNYYGDSYNSILLNSLYKLLDTKLKQYPSADLITQKIEFALHQSAKCPAFSVADANNQLISLQSFHEQYLLIDFWASWCSPCVKSLPYIEKIAAQYKHQNLKVLTASLDNDRDAWKVALAKYHLTENCRNVFLEKQFRNPMALQFNLSFIPYNVLVDLQGNIIARNIDDEELVNKLQTLFPDVKNEVFDNIKTVSNEPE